ncbi:MAG TPA: LysR family transcriptional regulator [Jatrophihabitans sp.]|nr:LysR family transcriptional regulator [Jatrophihabitans sp.]
MELRQLEYFVAVAEEMHFGRAAATLSIGQPAVSQQVARLERELGVRLFDRSSRTLRLTPAGGRFLPEARAVLAAAERARGVAADPAMTAASRTLRLGSSTGLGNRLNRVLQALGELLPTTSTELVSVPTRARLERVAGGQLDAAFVRGVTSAPGVELIEVWRDRLLAVLPAAQYRAADEPIRLAELATMPLRLVPRRLNPPLVDLVLGTCAAAGFTPVPGGTLGSLQDLIAAVGSGAPSWTVVYEPLAQTLHQPLVAFLPTEPALIMPTALAVPADATSRQVAPLLRACAAAESDDHGS